MAVQFRCNHVMHHVVTSSNAKFISHRCQEGVRDPERMGLFVWPGIGGEAQSPRLSPDIFRNVWGPLWLIGSALEIKSICHSNRNLNQHPCLSLVRRLYLARSVVANHHHSPETNLTLHGICPVASETVSSCRIDLCCNPCPWSPRLVPLASLRESRKC